jgi:hypothetical protein
MRHPAMLIWNDSSNINQLLRDEKKTKLHGLSPRANYTDRATEIKTKLIIFILLSYDGCKLNKETTRGGGVGRFASLLSAMPSLQEGSFDFNKISSRESSKLKMFGPIPVLSLSIR